MSTPEQPTTAREMYHSVHTSSGEAEMTVGVDISFHPDDVDLAWLEAGSALARAFQRLRRERHDGEESGHGAG